MNSLLNWIAVARWRKSLSHCFEAIPPYLIALLFSLWIWSGVVAVIAWFYAREVCQSQMRAKPAGTSTVTVWNVGYLPWKWDFWSRMDVLFPAVSSILFSILLNLCGVGLWLSELRRALYLLF